MNSDSGLKLDIVVSRMVFEMDKKSPLKLSGPQK